MFKKQPTGVKNVIIILPALHRCWEQRTGRKVSTSPTSSASSPNSQSKKRNTCWSRVRTISASCSRRARTAHNYGSAPLHTSTTIAVPTAVSCRRVATRRASRCAAISSSGRNWRRITGTISSVKATVTASVARVSGKGMERTLIQTGELLIKRSMVVFSLHIISYGVRRTLLRYIAALQTQSVAMTVKACLASKFKIVILVYSV